jgi:hypothetical protein
MAVPPQEVGQIDFGITAIAVGTQIHLLILECPPQPLHENVVVTALSARPADLDFLSLQPGHKVSRGELPGFKGLSQHPFFQGLTSDDEQTPKTDGAAGSTRLDAFAG